MLRLDLRSDYETEKHIVSILDIIVPKKKELFECNWIAIKAIPTAESCVSALKKYGFGLSEEVLVGFDGTKYGFYYTLEVKIMIIEKCKKESFVVIGKEGSTSDGEEFIQKLWDDANSHFGEIQHLAKKDENGNLVGIWGAMSDFSVPLSFGRTSARDFILLERSASMARKFPRDGQSGLFPHMNIFVRNVKATILFRR